MFRLLLPLQIYLFLEGVDPKKMESSIKPSSVDIKMHDVQGKNYRYAIPKLNKEIVPEMSKVVVKPTRVLITLAKSSKGNWLDLHSKEDKVLLGYSTLVNSLFDCIIG
jgi:calcyclin binding protein